MDMPFLRVQANGFAHKFIVDNLLKAIFFWSTNTERNIQINIEYNALSLIFLIIVNADKDKNLVVLQK